MGVPWRLFAQIKKQYKDALKGFCIACLLACHIPTLALTNRFKGSELKLFTLSRPGSSPCGSIQLISIFTILFRASFDNTNHCRYKVNSYGMGYGDYKKALKIKKRFLMGT